MTLELLLTHIIVLHATHTC